MDDAAETNPFSQVPIEITISVGKARPLVSELVELRRDSVLTLDSSIDDPVELYIGDRLIARGVPDEAVELAQRRLIAVNAAWEEIEAREAA